MTSGIHLTQPICGKRANNRSGQSIITFAARRAKLEALTLPSRNISDAGLVHLKDLRQLTNLRLYDTRVSDKGVAGLGGLTNLVLLDLRRTKVTAAGITQLRSMPNLRYLEGP